MIYIYRIFSNSNHNYYWFWYLPSATRKWGSKWNEVMFQEIGVHVPIIAAWMECCYGSHHLTPKWSLHLKLPWSSARWSTGSSWFCPSPSPHCWKDQTGGPQSAYEHLVLRWWYSLWFVWRFICCSFHLNQSKSLLFVPSDAEIYKPELHSFWDSHI